MGVSLRVEWWKLRRSPVTATATALMALLVPLMALGFFTVAREGGTGPLAEKAGALLVGEGWVGYLETVDQIAAVAMFVGAGVVVAWVFGREHSDRTFSSLFALPVPRSTIAKSKFLVLVVWATVLSIALVVVTVGVGFAADVGRFDFAEAGPELMRLASIAWLTTALALTIGLVASVGRGYLPAIGALILIVAIAQIAVLMGAGGWFPYAVPGLLALVGDPGAPELTSVQIVLVPATTAVAVWLTVHWWRRADVG